MAFYATPSQVQYEEMLRQKRLQEQSYRRSFDDPETFNRISRTQSMRDPNDRANQPTPPPPQNIQQSNDWLAQFPGQREPPLPSEKAMKSFNQQDTASSAWHANGVLPGANHNTCNLHQDYRLALKNHREATFRSAMAKYLQNEQFQQDRQRSAAKNSDFNHGQQDFRQPGESRMLRPIPNRESEKERLQKSMEMTPYDPFGRGGGGAPLRDIKGDPIVRNRGYFERSLSSENLARAREPLRERQLSGSLKSAPHRREVENFQDSNPPIMAPTYPTYPPGYAPQYSHGAPEVNPYHPQISPPQAYMSHPGYAATQPTHGHPYGPPQQHGFQGPNGVVPPQTTYPQAFIPGAPGAPQYQGIHPERPYQDGPVQSRGSFEYPAKPMAPGAQHYQSIHPERPYQDGPVQSRATFEYPAKPMAQVEPSVHHPERPYQDTPVQSRGSFEYPAKPMAQVEPSVHHPQAIPSASREGRGPPVGRPYFPGGRPHVGDVTQGPGYEAKRKAMEERYREELRQQIELKRREKESELERDRLEEERERRHIELVRQRALEQEQDKKNQAAQARESRRQKELTRTDQILGQSHAQPTLQFDQSPSPPLNSRARTNRKDDGLEWWERQPQIDLKKKDSAKIVTTLVPDPPARTRRRRSRDDAAGQGLHLAKEPEVYPIVLKPRLPPDTDDSGFDDSDKIARNTQRDRARHAEGSQGFPHAQNGESMPRQVEALQHRHSTEVQRSLDDPGFLSDASSEHELFDDYDALARTYKVSDADQQPFAARSKVHHSAKGLDKGRHQVDHEPERPGSNRNPEPERTGSLPQRNVVAEDPDPEVVEDYAEQMKQMRKKRVGYR